MQTIYADVMISMSEFKKTRPLCCAMPRVDPLRC